MGFPTSFSCSDTDKKTEGVQMRLEKPILFARADKGSLSERNPHYLRADNMGFSQINRVFLKKPTLSADNVGFFQKNLLYLRETHII